MKPNISSTTRTRIVRSGIAAMAVLCAQAVATTANLAGAQNYPARPVRIIVATGAGSSADALARVLAANLNPVWNNVGVVVENIAGAGGIVGTQTLVKAPPDGYTMAVLGINHAVNPAIYPKLPYDSVKDFRGVVSVSGSTMLIVAGPTFQGNSIADLIRMAKQNPGQINYGSTGNGTLPHLVMALFDQQANIDMTHVPYKSLPNMMTDLLAGRVSVGSVAGATALPLIKDGRLKVLVAASAKRSPFFPDVPLAAEVGLPGLAVRSWVGIIGPAGLPDAVVAKVYNDVRGFSEKKEFLTQLANNGFELNLIDGDTFWKNVSEDIPMWIRVVKQAGIKAD